MRIAIAQMGSRAGELQKTVTRMLDFARQAHDRGAELVIFPMAALTGPVPAEFADEIPETITLTISSTSPRPSPCCARRLRAPASCRS